MADTTAHSQTARLAQVLKTREATPEVEGASNAGITPVADENSLFRNVLAKTGLQEMPIGDEAEAHQQAAEFADRYDQLEAELKGVRLLDQKNVKDEQETAQLQSELAAMVAQKNMPRSQRPKIIDARVVEPGERKYPFTDLFNQAQRAIRNFIPRKAHEIAHEREALRSKSVQRTATVKNQLDNQESNRTTSGG